MQLGESRLIPNDSDWSRMQHVLHARGKDLDLLLAERPKRVSEVLPLKSNHNRNIYFSFDGRSHLTEKTANNKHLGTSLGIFEGKPFVVGNYPYNYPYNKKVEWLVSSWIDLADFPFAKQYIAGYSTVTVGEILFLFGTHILIVGTN